MLTHISTCHLLDSFSLVPWVPKLDFLGMYGPLKVWRGFTVHAWGHFESHQSVIDILYDESGLDWGKNVMNNLVKDLCHSFHSDSPCCVPAGYPSWPERSHGDTVSGMKHMQHL